MVTFTGFDARQRLWPNLYIINLKVVTNDGSRFPMLMLNHLANMKLIIDKIDKL